MLETGYGNDWISRGYDILNTGMIVINLMVSILITVDSVKEHYAGILQCIEFVTVSRRFVIVMIKRNGIILIPHGDLVLQVGDKLVLYTQSHVPNANQIEI